VLGIALCATAQAERAADENDALPDAPAPQKNAANEVTLRALPMNILKDQGAIWTSPLRIRARHLKFLLPLGVATGAAIATDKYALRDVVSHDKGFNDANTNVSNVLVGGILVTPAVLFGAGHFGGDEHAREAGLLGAEAIADGVIVEQGMKLIFWRERPYEGSGNGRFFQTSAGVDSSFPSSHSVLAWATAAVIAGEYPNPWTQVLVSTGATGVSLTRLLGQQHFPSDLLVGSAVGWLVGHYVFEHRHRERARRGHGSNDVSVPDR